MVKSPGGKLDGLTKGGKDLKSKDAIIDLKEQKVIKKKTREDAEVKERTTTLVLQTLKKKGGFEEILACPYQDPAGRQERRQASYWDRQVELCIKGH
jgi:hypothetical protein